MSAGYPKQKVYVYKEDGSSFGEFESEVAFSKHFQLDRNYLAQPRKIRFGEDVIPIFETGLYACNERVGRERIKTYHKKLNSPFIKQTIHKDRKIGCFNLEHKKIATFKGLFYLQAILGHSVNVLEEIPKIFRGEIYYKFLKPKNK